MSERGIEIKVGVLVTICTALLVAFVVLLGDFSTGGRADLFVDVPSSADLKPGAPVKVAGVPAGKVRGLEYAGGRYDEALGRRVWVRVHLRMEPEMLATVRRDGVFYITTQGVLGEKYVEIDPGSPEQPGLAPGDVVEGVPPIRLERMAMDASRLMAGLARIVEKNEDVFNSIMEEIQEGVRAVRRASERVDLLLADNREKVDRVIDELLEAEERLNTLLESAQVAVGDGEELKATIANARAISQEIRGQVKPVVADVRSALDKYEALAVTGQGALEEAKTSALGVLADARKAMGVVVTLAERIERGEGTVGALLADDEMYDDVREMMKDLKRNPWKFIWKE